MIHCIIYGEQEKHTCAVPGYTVPTHISGEGQYNQVPILAASMRFLSWRYVDYNERLGITKRIATH